MNVIVNGQAQKVDENATLTQLLEKMGLSGQRIAVERNGEIVPRSRYGKTQLTPQDRLEIVVAVGGG